MNTATPTPLTYDDLKNAVGGTAAGFRARTRLLPAGGDGDKVFPPTYEKGEYATEDRVVVAPDGAIKHIPTVLLDSVQSQANRMELALLAAIDQGMLQMPYLEVDFSQVGLPEVGRNGKITTFEAPHRIADAILRDSEIDGKPFRHRDSKKASQIGQRFDAANTACATPLFELCPAALIFGMWDSSGPKGGMGAKFQRALVSEIVGYDAVPGVRSSSRIDPLGIEKSAATLYEAEDGSWTLRESEAVKVKNGAQRVGKEGKPSEVLHGNITPTIQPGGFTISHAIQTTVLSLPALRRLSFPIDGKGSEDVNATARTLLAAVALAAVVLQRDQGYDLRSRCLLIPDEPLVFELLGDGPGKLFTVSVDTIKGIITDAANAATKVGLSWEPGPVTLKPQEKLKELVLKNRELLVTKKASD